MRCPYCGDRRTEVLKTVYRGHNSYRHRRLPLLRVPLQYPGEASTMEPRGAEVAGAPPIAEGMGESADAGSAREV